MILSQLHRVHGVNKIIMNEELGMLWKEVAMPSLRLSHTVCLESPRKTTK